MQLLLTYVFTTYCEYVMKISHLNAGFLLALALSNAQASADLNLVCKGAIESAASDTRSRFGNSRTSKQAILDVEVREERKISPSESMNHDQKRDFEKMFPGGLRTGTVTVNNLATANLLGPRFDECFITDSRISCLYEREKTMQGTFVRKNNMPKRQLPEIDLKGLGISSSLPEPPKELESRASARISLDRHTGLLDLEFRHKFVLPVRTAKSEPFVASAEETGRLSCELIPDKPKF